MLLIAAAVSVALIGAGCGATGSEVHDSAEAAKDGGRAAQNLGEDAGRYHPPGVNPGSFDAGQGIAEVAATKADNSAQLLSEETGIAVNDARERVCSLLEVYESEGSYGDFVPWAMDEMGIPEPSRIYAEEALGKLEEAVGEAERGDVLGAFVSSVCAF